jgi:2-polyprenyl-3-methyl-5-hydroxy-6-metoxy-1,4-benzoquinol methylase
MDVYSFDNEIYNSLSNRFVLHIHNLLNGSWHQERQKTILQLIQIAKPTTAIDVGFGVPSRYMKELVLMNGYPKLTLCDFSDSAFQFATVLLDQWDSKWQEVISFKQVDMNDVEAIGKYDTYLFQDSIEHVADPASCLKKYVELAADTATFYIFSSHRAAYPRTLHSVANRRGSDRVVKKMWS